MLWLPTLRVQAAAGIGRGTSFEEVLVSRAPGTDLAQGSASATAPEARLCGAYDRRHRFRSERTVTGAARLDTMKFTGTGSTRWQLSDPVLIGLFVNSQMTDSARNGRYDVGLSSDFASAQRPRIRGATAIGTGGAPMPLRTFLKKPSTAN